MGKVAGPGEAQGQRGIVRIVVAMAGDTVVMEAMEQMVQVQEE